MKLPKYNLSYNTRDLIYSLAKSTCERTYEIIGFCFTTSSHISNFPANHAHHAHLAQSWSVEPLSDFHLDPPLRPVAIAAKLLVMHLPMGSLVLGTLKLLKIGAPNQLLKNLSATDCSFVFELISNVFGHHS